MPKPRIDVQYHRVQAGVRLDPPVKDFLQMWVETHDCFSLSTLINDICNEWVAEQRKKSRR